METKSKLLQEIQSLLRYFNFGEVRGMRKKNLTLWDGIKSIFIQTLFENLITSLSVVSATYREVEIRFTYLYFYSSFCCRLIANETERKFKEFYC